MLCNAQTVTTRATFEKGDPLIVVVDILPGKAEEKDGRRIARDVQLNDMKRVLLIGKAKYVCVSS
jgi:hypothetical protein